MSLRGRKTAIRLPILSEENIRFFFGIALMSGLAWSLLPGGLVFDPAHRAELLKDPNAFQGLFALQWLPLLGFAAAFAAARLRSLTTVLPHANIYLILLLVWALISSLWAPDSGQVLRQIIGLTAASLLGLSFTIWGWNSHRLDDVLRFWFTVALFASLVVGVVRPDIAIHSEKGFELEGSWRGITYQKNGLGQLAACSTILWVHYWASGRALWTRAFPGIGLSLLLLILSRSSTSLLLSLISCFLVVSMLRPPIQLGQMRVPGIIAMLAAIIIVFSGYLVINGAFDSEGVASVFASIFGKDATFSGRTYIWDAMMPQIYKHFWIGGGFNSFWGNTPQAHTIQQILGWPCPNGHNGYLDLWAGAGFIGLMILALAMLRHVQDALLILPIYRSEATLHLGLLLYVALANLTESSLFVPMAFLHLVFVWSSASLSRLRCDMARYVQMIKREQSPPLVFQA